MKVKIKPQIDESQRVVLLLNEYQRTEDQPAKTYRFDAQVTESNAIEIALDQAKVGTGDYLVRVQVDGVESPLQVDAKGYSGPIVKVETISSPQIAMEVKALDGNQVTVQGRVTVRNDKDQIVPNTQVFIKWTSPTGSPSNQNAKTNDNGIATFTISGPSGIYKLEVEEVKIDAAHGLNRSVGEFARTIDTRLKYLRCTEIILQIVSEENNKVTISGIVKVIDETGNSAPNAKISIQWTMPDSSIESQTEKTDQNGNAVFTVENDNGQYTIDIIDIAKSGYTFDRESSELSKSIDVIIKELRSTEIELTSMEEESLVHLNGSVIVEDKNGSRIQGANVSVRWDLADGTSQNQIANTDNQGVASFVASNGRGTYTLTITDIAKQDYVLNSNRSVLTKELTTAIKALRTTDIDLSIEETGETVTVHGKVTIKDETGFRIPEATVSVQWDMADGTTQNQNADTDNQGMASFTIANGRGSYTLTVTDVTKTGYLFDPDHSMLQQSIVSPSKRLLCTDIGLSAKESGDTVTVTGRVLVEDESGSSIKGTNVMVQWNLPDGTNQEQTADTSGKGIATFSVSNGRGTYTLTIAHIVKDGYTYDPGNSVVSKSVVSPTSCIRSAHIELQGEGRDDFAIVTCGIFVKDDNDTPIADATIFLTCTLPDNTAQSLTGNTNNIGVAKSTISNGRGVYTVTITNISKDGYAFDPDNSVLSKNITV